MSQLGTADELRNSILDLVENTYISILRQEFTEAEKELAAVALREYMNVLSHLRVDFDQLPLLPASFQMYAKCVGGIMDTLMTQSDGFMRISTFLSRPLTRWYNLQELLTPDGRVWTFTTDEWEAYKQCIRRLKDAWQLHTEDSPRIQLRRFVARTTADANARLCVYVGNDDAASALTLEAARRIAARLPKSLQLLPAVASTLDDTDVHYKMYLIAHLVDGRSLPADWRSLENEFHATYHNNPGTDPCGLGDRCGVFCKYITPAAGFLSNYDDVFLVSRVDGAGPFGIGWHDDKSRGVSGLVFLPDHTIQQLLDDLETIWKQKTHG